MLGSLKNAAKCVQNKGKNKNKTVRLSIFGGVNVVNTKYSGHAPRGACE